MARQATTPVTFPVTQRVDTSTVMSSARAGVVVPVTYFPLLPGDSCSGQVGIDVQLAEMPKPLLNAVTMNAQAWFVPKSAHPQFPGRDELMHSMTGEDISSLGAADRNPPAFFTQVSGAGLVTAAGSDLLKTLGIHVPAGGMINSDLIDAFNLVYNFRLASYSSKLARRKYYAEDAAQSTTLPPAFWLSNRFQQVVPDYERALIVGALELDVLAGRLPVVSKAWTGQMSGSDEFRQVSGGTTGKGGVSGAPNRTVPSPYPGKTDYRMWVDGADEFTVFAEMAGAGVSITLADIDMARTTQAFAKLRTAYAGNDVTGFDNDDTIVSLLMRGIAVPPDAFKRPWLLGNKRVPVSFAERFATDAGNLDQSLTRGRASAVLPLNVPVQDVSGVVIVTVEVLPERIDERMADEWMLATDFDDLPNALRDIQRVEPVDLVANRRLDTAHTSPDDLYGYEPMNAVWNRQFTRLGGHFYEAAPNAGFTDNRSNIWQAEIVDPAFNSGHFLAPDPFPHSVFSDTLDDAFEFVARHAVTISGITQIGDPLAEDNGDYDAVEQEGQ